MVGENAWIERRGIQLSTKIQRGCGSYIRQRMEKGRGNFPYFEQHMLELVIFALCIVQEKGNFQ